MATVTTKLTITSSDLTSQTLSLAINKAITASHTTGVARTKVGQTAVHADAAAAPMCSCPPASCAAASGVYAKLRWSFRIFVFLDMG